MSAARFDIGRIAVTLLGISASDAQSTAQGLEAALADRLGGWRPDIAGIAPMNLGNVDLGSVQLGARLDAPALASLIAARLIDHMDSAIARTREDV